MHLRKPLFVCEKLTFHEVKVMNKVFDGSSWNSGYDFYLLLFQ